MQGIDVHFMKNDFEVGESTVIPAQESGQKEMGEGERAPLSIGDDKDDINLRKQFSKQLHLLKLFPIRNRKNRDRIRFDGPPEPFLEVGQGVEEFDLTDRNRLSDRIVERCKIGIIPAGIKKKFHGVPFMRPETSLCSISISL